MNISTPTVTATRSLQLWSSVRDDLRTRRAARSERRSLERELASYTTRAEVDDLLALLDGADDEHAELIRSILLDNLREQRGYGLLAS